jgi:hypothetical protein
MSSTPYDFGTLKAMVNAQQIGSGLIDSYSPLEAADAFQKVTAIFVVFGVQRRPGLNLVGQNSIPRQYAYDV